MNDESFFPEPQVKPPKKLNYSERVKAGLQRGGLKQRSTKKIERDKLESKEHNKNIVNETVFCWNCGSSNNCEKHHPYGRSRPDTFVYLCSEFGCGFHKWIHDNSDEAYKLGWLQPRYRGLPDNDNWPKPWMV